MLGEDGCARAPSSGGEGVAGALADSSDMLMISHWGLAEMSGSMQKLLDKSQLKADHSTM